MIRATHTELPLTAGQAEIWRGLTCSGTTTAYNSTGYLDIRGALDLGRFCVAVQRMVEEAECLRAHFVNRAGDVVQSIRPLTELPLVELDFSGAGDPYAAALAWMREDLDTPFDVGCPPLFRLGLIRVGADRVLFYVCVHHLLCDGYSQVIMWRRLCELYQEQCGGPVATPMPPLSELLEREGAYRSSRRVQRDARFWRQRFEHTPEPVSLSQRETPRRPPPGFLRRNVTVGPATTNLLRTTARQADVTLPTVLMAAAGTYTRRMTGHDDVLITLAATTRTDARLRLIPGMLSNDLPLPIPYGPGLTKSALLAATSRELAGVLRHQSCRVEDIRRCVGLSPDERRPFGPFVNVLPQPAELALGDCNVRVHNLTTGLIDDLMITVIEEAGDTLEICLNGNPDLYGESEIADHLARVTAFVERFARADGDEQLDRLSVTAAPHPVT